MTDKVFMEKARKIITGNMANPDFGVETFAKMMSLSRVQLHRRIRALFHQSPGGFIRSRRLSRAAELLKAQNDSVTAVAHRVGFTNLSWFTKCFREEFHVNPSGMLKNVACE